jgi:hypothetical protein
MSATRASHPGRSTSGELVPSRCALRVGEIDVLVIGPGGRAPKWLHRRVLARDRSSSQRSTNGSTTGTVLPRTEGRISVLRTDTGDVSSGGGVPARERTERGGIGTCSAS